MIANLTLLDAPNPPLALKDFNLQILFQCTHVKVEDQLAADLLIWCPRLAPKLLWLKSILRSLKRTNGPQSRSLTNFSTMRSKNKHSCASRSVAASWEVNWTNRWKKKQLSAGLKQMKMLFTINFNRNTSSFSVCVSKKSVSWPELRPHKRKSPVTDNFLKISASVDKRKNKISELNSNLLIDLKMKWRMKDLFKVTSVNKSASILRKCLLKTKWTKLKYHKRSSVNGNLIFKPKRNISACSTNRNRIVSVNSLLGNVVPKNLWTTWLATLSKFKLNANVMRMKHLPNMKWSVNSD